MAVKELKKKNQPSSNREAPTWEGANNAAELDRWPFLQSFNFMKNEAMSWQPAWKEQSLFINPTRGFFNNETPNRGKKIDHKTVLDGHARRCIRTLASGMVSGLTSPSRPWFRIGVPDQKTMMDPEVKVWCDIVQRVILDMFGKSNIYNSLHTMYEEIATFGTAAMYLEDDFERVMRSRIFTIGEYFLRCGPDGRVNGFARQFWMTVGQLVEKFGYEKCTPSVQKDYDNDTIDKWVRVNHLVEVNDDRIPGYIDFKHMKYRSIYWEDGSAWNTYLKLGGYERFPLLAPRWETTTTMDIYGRGPGWDGLGDVKMLQKQQRQKLLAKDKVNDPPVQQDSSVQGDANTLPGGISRFSAMTPNAGVKPAYQINPDLQGMRLDIEDAKRAISETFYADLFIMLLNDHQGPQKTAEEIRALQSEKLTLLGPVLERLEGEALTPLVEDGFDKAWVAGLIPPPPEKLRGTEVKIQYISILAQAQRMVGITAMNQWVGNVMAQVEINPESVDIVNFDEVNAESADMLGVPAKVVNPPAVLAQKRKARAAAQKQAADLQTAEIMAKAGKGAAGAAKDLSQAEMGNGSALDAALGGMTGNQP